MRIALIANAASGGGLDPEPLADTMRRHGAEVRAYGCNPDDLGGVAAWAPERLAVAGGDGTVGTAARARRPPEGPARGDRHRHGQRLRARLGAAHRAGGGVRARRHRQRAAPDGARAPRRRPPVRQRRQRRARLGGGSPRRAVQVVLRPARLPARRPARRDHRGPAALHGLRRRRGGLRRRGLAGDRRGHRRVRRRLGHRRRRPRGRRARHGDPARRLAARARPPRLGPAPRQHRRAGRRLPRPRDVVEVGLPPGTEFNVDGEVRDHGMERITVEHHAYELVVG